MNLIKDFRERTEIKPDSWPWPALPNAPGPSFWVRAEYHVRGKLLGSQDMLALVVYNTECYEIEYARLVLRDQVWLEPRCPFASKESLTLWETLLVWASQFLGEVNGPQRFQEWWKLLGGADRNPREVWEAQAFLDGVDAFHRGLGISDNPYVLEDPSADKRDLAGAWLRGYERDRALA